MYFLNAEHSKFMRMEEYDLADLLPLFPYSVHNSCTTTVFSLSSPAPS